MRTLLVSIGLLCISFLLLRETWLLPDGKLHLYMLDVGQGDSLFLVTPSGKQILVDGGPDLSTLSSLNTLMPFFDRSIDLMIVTHPDADHITALPSVIDRYSVGSVLMTNDDHASSIYSALQSKIAQSHIPVLTPDPHADIDMGDGTVLDVIWPKEDYDDTSNNRCVVVRVLYKDHAILLTGDIEARAERAILATGADVRSDILKVPHHGSHTSSSSGFLLAVHPDLALISVGKDNPYGHPHQDILERYDSFGIPKKTTANEGMVSLEF